MDVGSGRPPENHFFITSCGAVSGADQRKLSPAARAAPQYGQGFQAFTLWLGIRLVGLDTQSNGTRNVAAKRYGFPM